MGSQPRLAPVRSGAASTQGYGQGSGGFRCRYLVRFRTVPVQIPREVPDSSGEDTCWGCGSGGCRYLLRFRRVPVQIPCEGPEVSSAGRRLRRRYLVSIYRGFWCSYLMRFRRVYWWRCVVRFWRDTLWGSGQFRWRYLLRVRFRRVYGCRCLVSFRKVPVRRPCEVGEGSGAETLWGSGGIVKFWRVLVQMLFEIPKGSDVLFMHKHLIFLA